LRRHFLKDTEVLDFKEILALVGLLADRGIRHVRLTGGEPLLRPRLVSFVKELAQVPSLEILSLTTNGFLLPELLAGLKRGGLQRINISLDTLQEDRFRRLTGRDGLRKAREAIVAAARMGFDRVKINVIVMRGFNDDEIQDFVDFGIKHRVDVRFIEIFPTHGRCDRTRDIFFASADVKRKIEASWGALEPLGTDMFCGPAQYFKIKGASSRIGFISSVSDFFCGTCNRLRLTSDGKLYPCLHSDHHADLKDALRSVERGTLGRLIDDVIDHKEAFNRAVCSRAFEMSGMGG
jgi:cyclic pyranopterin phosphate synthase